LFINIAKIRSGSKKVQDGWSRLNASRAARNSFAGRMFITSVPESSYLVVMACRLTLTVQSQICGILTVSSLISHYLSGE